MANMNSNHRMDQENHNWLSERRDLFLKNLVKYFFSSLAFFRDLKEHTRRYGIRYDGFEFWVGTEKDRGILWEMKDICHLLWDSDQADSDPDGVMLDWMLGTLFHEAMKLKENAYMLERYRSRFPTAAAVRDDLEENPAHTEAHKCELFFDETEKETERSIKRIECLFARSFQLLTTILQKDRDNPLMVRYLLEEISDANGHWPEGEGPKALLAQLFPDGLDRAWCLAGESYLEGGWFDEARAAFERALKEDPESAEAKSGLRLLEKRVGEIDAALKRELRNQAGIKNRTGS